MSLPLKEKAKLYLKQGIITKDTAARKGPGAWCGWREGEIKTIF